MVAVHIHHHSDPAIERRLDRIEAALEHVIGELKHMALIQSQKEALARAMEKNTPAGPSTAPVA